MGLGARAEFKGVFGYPDPRAYGFSVKARDAYARALRSPGSMRNLIALGDLERGNDDSAIALMLRPVIAWQDASNAAASYSATEGGTYLDERPNCFGDGKAGLSYSRSDTTGAGEFESVANLIDAGAPFALRFRPYKIEQEYPVITFRAGRFQFEITKNSARIIRLSATHTQAQEETLHGLLADTSITALEQTTIDELQEAIYLGSTSIDLPGELFGQAHTLIFVPEPRGVVNVLDGQMRFITSLDLTDIQDTGADGVVWPDSTLFVRSNGPAFDWQFGTLRHAPTGQLRLGRYSTFDNGTWTYSSIKSTPTDTSVTIANTTLSESHDEIVIDFATDNPAISPLFYMGYAYRQPGDRTRVADTVLFDTASVGSVFMDLEPQLERLHRRATWNGTLRDVSGTVSSALAVALAGTGKEFRYPAGEDLVCNLYITDGVTEVCVLHTGIVKAAGHNDLDNAEENQVLSAVKKGESKLSMVFSDQWLILDERVLEDVLPVGDGLRLGAYIRDLLQLVGIPSSAMGSVSVDTGRLLPQARPGESWRVQPSPGTTLGEWLRHILELYGMGLELWIDNAGVWHLATRSTTPVFTITTAATNRAQSPFAALDAWRDSSDVYNVFRVEGGAGANGLPLVAEWVINRGFRTTGVPGSRYYIGRIKAFPAVRDSGLRTQDDCDYAVRSLAMAHARPGAGLKHDTYLPQFLNVFPGDRGTVYGRTMELLDIQGGSIAFGSSDEASELRGRCSLVLGEIEDLF